MSIKHTFGWTVAAVLLLGSSAAAAAQGHGIPEISFSDNFYAGSSDTLAFWAVNGAGGIVPKTGGNILKLSAYSRPSSIGNNGFRWGYGADIAAVMSIGSDRMEPILSEGYASIGWKCISLNAGCFRKKSDFSSVSLSGGDITNSGNARTQPGYSISLDRWTLPFGGGRLAISGSWGDYIFLDPRSIPRPFVHNEEGYLDIKITERLTLRAGGEDWGMWGGAGAEKKLSDYFRMAFGLGGGDSAHPMDQVNALGNHLGRTLVRLSWKGDGWTASLSKDSPFEDASGIKQRNFPDGIWTAYLHRDKPRAWLSDLAVEFIYTRSQSGSLHARPATEEEMSRQDPSDPNFGTVILGGQDEYFNHYWHSSGWTSYGMTIGVPLMLARPAAPDGICYGVVSNVCEGIHIGAGGYLGELFPYRLRATFARHWGKCTEPFQSSRTLCSLAFDGSVPHEIIFAGSGTKLDFNYGVYADTGTLYQPGITVMLGVKYTL